MTRKSNTSFTSNMKKIFRLEECEPKKLIKELKEETIKALTFAREKYFEQDHSIICREYMEDGDEEFSGLTRDYFKEMSENMPRHFEEIQRSSEALWSKYTYIQEAYTYLRRVAPSLLIRSNKDLLEILDGMLILVDYHNKIQSRLANWKDVIKYYNERGIPVVLVEPNPDLVW